MGAGPRRSSGRTGTLGVEDSPGNQVWSACDDGKAWKNMCGVQEYGERIMSIEGMAQGGKITDG